MGSEKNLSKHQPDRRARPGKAADLLEDTQFSHVRLNALGAHIAVINHQGDIIQVNYAWTQFALENGPEVINGLSVGANYFNVCKASYSSGDQEAKYVLQGIKSILLGQQSVFEHEYPCHSPDDERWFSMRVTPFSIANKMHAVISHENINERKKAEEELRQSELRLKDAEELAHVGHWELNLLTNKLHWSDEVYRMFGLTPQEFEASYEAFLSVVHEEDRMSVNKAYTDSLKNKTPYEIDHRILLNDGSLKYVHEKCITEFSADGQPLRSLGTVQDITEKKRLEHSLINAVHAGQEQERKRIAKELHDGLGQQLAAAKMLLEAIGPNIGILDQEDIQLFEQAQTVMDEAVKDVRVISHDLIPSALEEKGLVIALERLCHHIKESGSLQVDFFRPGMKGRRFRPTLEIGLFRIAQELMANIIKHAQATQVKILLAEQSNNIILKIADNGVGFEGTFEDIQHNGIGLRNIAARVKGLNGKLTLDSTLDIGTTVLVEVPIDHG
ncbi:MAG: PAS domain-containing protein [Cyclobacteriaceae bacterium]